MTNFHKTIKKIDVQVTVAKEKTEISKKIKKLPI
jgi:hypothetical protein